MNVALENPALAGNATLSHDTSDRGEGEVVVSGTLPAGLSGVLYRNGPGRFRRGGRVKRLLLDGDGVIQRLALQDGRARYARRFVRTPKFQAESAADRFLYPTWTTRAPGWRRNLGGAIPSQAGVTVLPVGPALLACDEVAPAFAIDPADLATRAPVALGLPDRDDGMKAHARHVAATGDWVFLSTRMGRDGMRIDFVRHRRDGTRVTTPTVRAPRMVYVHDFAVSGRFALLVLHPTVLRPLRFLAGLTSFTEALDWRPELGNLVLQIDLETGAATRFDAPSAWVWHIANAWEQGDAVVMDFVGYDDPGHFFGPDAQLRALMQGRDGVHGAPGTLRRHVLDRRSGAVESTTLAPGQFEFPSVDGRCGSARHRRIYLTRGTASGILHSGIAAFDTRTGALDAFDFGRDVQVGEPVFAARPGGAEDEGWLIAQTLDAARQVSEFAVFDAGHVADGPIAQIAQIALGEPVPLGFHGCWVPG